MGASKPKQETSWKYCNMDLNYQKIPEGYLEKIVRKPEVREHLVVMDRNGVTGEMFHFGPVIEQVRGFSTPDSRVAMILRDVCLYRHGHKDDMYTDEERELIFGLQKVTFGADLSGRKIPFSPLERQIFLYSEERNGNKAINAYVGYSANFIIRPDENYEAEYKEFFQKLFPMWSRKAHSFEDLMQLHLKTYWVDAFTKPRDLVKRALMTFDEIREKIRSASYLYEELRLVPPPVLKDPAN